MKNILIFGAGRSSSSLIKYLLDLSQVENWFITVLDADLKTAESKVGSHPNAACFSIDASDKIERINRPLTVKIKDFINEYKTYIILFIILTGASLFLTP